MRPAQTPNSRAPRATRYLLIGLLSTAVSTPLLAQSSGSVQQRLARLERLLDSSALVNMLQRLDALQRDIQAIQGDNEVQDHAIKSLKQRQRELYADVDHRLQALEGGRIAASAAGEPNPSTGTAASAAATNTSASVTADPARERSDYRSAFALLRDGHSADAITAFGTFLATYPNGHYAANAQYWIGEALYVEHKFDEAMTAFNKLIETYPDSSKLPDALLKIGYIHAEQQRVSKARETLQDLARRYPSSAAAGLAKQRLKTL